MGAFPVLAVLGLPSNLDAIAWSSPYRPGEVNGGRFASQRIDPQRVNWRITIRA
jgi:hypothetical protein